MPAPAPTQLIDRVDESNNPVGTVRRRDALSTGVNFRTVHVLLRDARGRILLQRIPATRPRFPGRLGSSVAGYLHRGEGFREAATRRTLEEVGIHPGLEGLGTLEMIDQQSRKFVGVFWGDGEGAEPQDQQHVAELVAVLPSELDLRLAGEPDRFTPTFAEVWRYARSRLP